MRTVAAIAVLCAGCGSSDSLGQRLGSLPQLAHSLVAGPTKLYGSNYSYAVYEIEPTGGSTKILQGVGPEIAAAGNQVYFRMVGSFNGGIGAYDTTAASQRTVVPATLLVEELLADANRVYWVDYDSSSGVSTVHAVNIDGTGETALGPGTGILQDDQALYWTNSQIIRASKADLASRSTLANSSYQRGKAAASGGNVYWLTRGSLNQQVLTIPADASATVPTVFATVPSEVDITGIQVLAGVVYLGVTTTNRGDCCVYTSRIVQIGHGNQVEIVRALNLDSIPILTAGAGGLFWSVESVVYRVR
jgi:hypothetical protein